jgi:hypothetical protein
MPAIPDTIAPFARDLIAKCCCRNPEQRPLFCEVLETLRAAFCGDVDLTEVMTFISEVELQEDQGQSGRL